MKTLFQYLFAALMLCTAIHATAQQSDPPEEVALYEALRDVNALVKAGVSLNDFRARMPDLAVLLDRMKRKGVDSSDLASATSEFRESVSPWSEYIKWQVQVEREKDRARLPLLVEMATATQNLRDLKWQQADLSLSQYAATKARQAEEAKAKADAEAKAAAEAKAKADAEAAKAKSSKPGKPKPVLKAN
jgi:hypothetical protein